jgi:hypothetical protein
MAHKKKREKARSAERRTVVRSTAKFLAFVVLNEIEIEIQFHFQYSESMGIPLPRSITLFRPVATDSSRVAT